MTNPKTMKLYPETSDKSTFINRSNLFLQNLKESTRFKFLMRQEN